MHMKDLEGMIRDGMKKVMSGYQSIKSNANPNIFGQAADAMGRATGRTRSGAPAPPRRRPPNYGKGK